MRCKRMMMDPKWHESFSPVILETTVPQKFVDLINKAGDEVLSDEEKKKLQEQSDYINQLNVELGQSINKVEEDVQTIKSSKYGKKIWKVKKK